MLNYQKINDITGWLVFLFATTVYVLTVEPTASFWDCGEFIAVSYKLMVPHPPGAPIFLLLGRMFSMLSFGDVTQVAYWINIMSALASSFTVLFTFWTITMLSKKIFAASNTEETPAIVIATMAAGVIGAASLTFADSFWFSAVEGEVYGLSSFFTAIVVWAILKWEIVADETYADRWIILIAYLVGLSVGVHLLNLLTIPALALIYYYKKYEATTKGVVYTMIASIAILAFIQYGLIQEFADLAGKFDVFFVNSLGLPFSSGIITFLILIIGSIIYGIRYSITNNKYILNLALLCLVFISVGYASYTLILIKSNNNPPLNENAPDDVMSFVSYLKREQYGDRPLFHGQQFTAKLVDQKRGEAKYKPGKDKYEIYDYKIINEFDKKHTTIFPRMYSSQPGHKAVYEGWSGAKNGRKPTFMQNLKFFFTYQVNHMYYRYFMWNFSGRENDIQDSDWLAPWDLKTDMPSQLANNKTRNNFYMLPLILGIIGFYFHAKKHPKDSFFVMLLFFFTGLAIVIYLNQYPNQPRERDYAYAGSYYAFAIWIGLGVLGVFQGLQKYIKDQKMAAIAATLLCLTAPLIMGVQGWDDHDRSDRYTAVDSAKNLLNSCAPNAIIFTNGDNDTFPLWYVQEVEGFRTDVRVCNLSLINTDWYISQMKRKTYESEALPISLEEENFQQGTNEYIPFVENKKVPSMPVDTYMKLLKSNSRAIQVPLQSGEMISSFPTKTFELAVDKEKVLSTGTVDAKYADKLVDKMVWKIPKSSLSKQDIMILDILANNNWERPVYFAITVGPSSYLGLEEYFQLEGFAYRIVPIRAQGSKNGRVDTEKMYTNLMNNFFWRHMDDSTVYYDENHNRFALNARNNYNRLANSLIAEGQPEKAKAVLQYCLKILPDHSFNYDVFTTQFISTLLALKEDKLAFEISAVMAHRADENLEYYLNLDSKKVTTLTKEQIGLNWHILREVFDILSRNNKKEEADKYEQKIKVHYDKLLKLS